MTAMHLLQIKQLNKRWMNMSCSDPKSHLFCIISQISALTWF